MSFSFYKAVSLFLSSKYYYNIKKAMQPLAYVYMERLKTIENMAEHAV